MPNIYTVNTSLFLSLIDSNVPNKQETPVKQPLDAPESKCISPEDHLRLSYRLFSVPNIRRLSEIMARFESKFHWFENSSNPYFFSLDSMNRTIKNFKELFIRYNHVLDSLPKCHLTEFADYCLNMFINSTQDIGFWYILMLDRHSYLSSLEIILSKCEGALFIVHNDELLMDDRPNVLNRLDIRQSYDEAIKNDDLSPDDINIFHLSNHPDQFIPLFDVKWRGYINLCEIYIDPGYFGLSNSKTPRFRSKAVNDKNVISKDSKYMLRMFAEFNANSIKLTWVISRCKDTKSGNVANDPALELQQFMLNDKCNPAYRGRSSKNNQSTLYLSPPTSMKFDDIQIANVRISVGNVMENRTNMFDFRNMNDIRLSYPMTYRVLLTNTYTYLLSFKNISSGCAAHDNVPLFTNDKIKSEFVINYVDYHVKNFIDCLLVRSNMKIYNCYSSEEKKKNADCYIAYDSFGFYTQVTNGRNKKTIIKLQPNWFYDETTASIHLNNTKTEKNKKGSAEKGAVEKGKRKKKDDSEYLAALGDIKHIPDGMTRDEFLNLSYAVGPDELDAILKDMGLIPSNVAAVEAKRDIKAIIKQDCRNLLPDHISVNMSDCETKLFTNGYMIKYKNIPGDINF